MFSRRTAWDRGENPLARRLGRAGGPGRAAAGPHRVQPHPLRARLPGPENPRRPRFARRLRLRAGAPRAALGARGGGAAPGARGRGGGSADALVLTASTSEAYGWLFKLLCDPGDNGRCVPRPATRCSSTSRALECVELAPVPPAGGGGLRRWTWRRWPPQGPRATRAVIVVNPANPTGQFLTRGELDALRRSARTRAGAHQRRGVLGVRVGRGRGAGALGGGAGGPALTFVLSGLSKVAGLPQLKLGWMRVGGPAAAKAEALGRLDLVADTYLRWARRCSGRPGAAGDARRVQARSASGCCTTAPRSGRPGPRTPRGTCSRARAAGPRCCGCRAAWTRRPCACGCWTRAWWRSRGTSSTSRCGRHLVVSLLVEPEVFREGVRRLAQVLRAAF